MDFRQAGGLLDTLASVVMTWTQLFRCPASFSGDSSLTDLRGGVRRIVVKAFRSAGRKMIARV